MAQSYQITEAYFIAANRHARRRLVRVLVVAMVLVLALFPALHDFSRDSIVASVGTGVLLLLFLWLVLPALQRGSLRRTYRKNPLLQREQEVELLPTGFVLRSSNGEARYHFGELKKVELLDDLVLVYPTTTLFHIIPINLLDDFALTQFRALG